MKRLWDKINEQYGETPYVEAGVLMVGMIITILLSWPLSGILMDVIY